MLESLNKRYQHDDITDGETYICSTVLAPRFKTTLFQNKDHDSSLGRNVLDKTADGKVQPDWRQ